ncbi:hypothetical protein [Glaciihabitans sp. dw_435]|uniref:hypothetical protein n=1 Tax=Glaciihabitans sp. dw_435 TaxID=2720081 RepID=UPI001BD2E96B|nr:hypothetical protein [Glaciihabitans sp. dw_435]
MAPRKTPLIGSAKTADELGIDRSTLTRWVKSEKITPELRGSGATGEMFFDPEVVAALKKTINDLADAESVA